MISQRRCNEPKELSAASCGRNAGERGYRPGQAQKRSCWHLRARRGGKPLAPRVSERCFELVRLGHSPQQAAGRCCKEGGGSVSHETLYQLIYTDKAAGGRLWRSLRCCKKRRKRYRSGRQRRGQIPHRVGIERRCPRVEARASVGHWEGDTVIGRNHKFAIVPLVERKTG